MNGRLFTTGDPCGGCGGEGKTPVPSALVSVYDDGPHVTQYRECGLCLGTGMHTNPDGALLVAMVRRLETAIRYAGRS